MRSGLIFILLALFIGVPLATLAEEPQQVPVATFTGRILFVQDDKVALRSGSAYIAVTVGDATQTNGSLDKGLKATVKYRVGDNYALEISTDET